ncbi:MAG: hypothetical protein II671_01485, partial [Salinivirgaceae bacterium]|nr:hypothetical protein [Salinivirgaceae bacterium]
MMCRKLKIALLLAFAGVGISWAQSEPTKDGEDYYLLGTVDDVEWFALQVNGGMYDLKAKLTADIDYEGKTHTPIGTNFTDRFDGVFDGQGHKITNLTMNQSGYVGFFGSLGGPNGAQIKNLTIGSTCSFRSTSSHVGAFAGITYYADATNMGVIRFQNCVNEAAVSGENGCVAGFIGAGQGNKGYCALRFENCANKGAISTSAKRCAAFMLNSSNNVALINCYNSGLLTGVKNNNNGGWGYNNLCEPTSEKKVTLTNCYDVSETTNRGQGTAKDAATMASGELCYLLNGDQSDVQWYQIVGLGSPIPSVISGGQVFAHGSQYCDGTPAGAATVYNNEGPNEFINLGHDYVNGICSRDCTEKYQPAEKDGEGWYLIANVGNLEWYAAFVNKGSGNNYKSAKLTADIDFAGTNVTHTTIGQGDSNKYSASFDGQGHSIKNMVIYKPENDRIGLFGVIRGSSAHISNIVIESSCSFTGK